MFETKYAIDDLNQLHREAQAVIKQNLKPAEFVRVIIRGPWDQALIGTDSRLFIFKKGLMGGVTFGTKMRSWEYKNLTGIQIETGPKTGYVAIQGLGIEAQDLNFWDSGSKSPASSPHAIPLTSEIQMDQAKVGVEILRDLIIKEQTDQPIKAKTPGIPRQISKLTELKNQGLLTQEEFDLKKKDLLARM